MITKRTQVFGDYVEGSTAREELVRFLRDLDEQLNGYADLLWAYNGELDEDVVRYSESFPDILRKSFVVMLVVHVEQEARALAASMKRVFETPLALGDLKGSIAERFLTFSTKVAGLEISLTNAEVQDFLAVFEIRNCLVHADGWLPSFGRRATIEAFVNRNGYPEIVDGRIVIDRQACLFCFDCLSGVLEKVYDEALKEAERRDAQEPVPQFESNDS